MHAKDFQLGSLKDGYRVTVDVRLEEVTGRPAETIAHHPIERYWRFGISGAILRPARGWFNGDCGECGQILDTLRKAEWTTVAAGVDLQTIFTFWQRWHLNDMQAPCKHQEWFTDHDNWEARAAIETAKCPQGYKYGSQWLVKPIPEQEIARIVRMFFPRDLATSGVGKNGNGRFIA